MKYFIDTEFHEYSKQPKICGIKVGKAIDTIELISIGIVSEDIPNSINSRKIGASDYAAKELLKNPLTHREYYAICKEFDIKAAWNNEWLRENVLKPIWIELEIQHLKDYNSALWLMNQDADWKSLIKEEFFNITKLKDLLQEYGKTKKQIAKEIIKFTSPVQPTTNIIPEHMCFPEQFITDYSKPEFYAYYADYDWVVFCWLFGRMNDLPTGFPMYCKDLKQELDLKQHMINTQPSHLCPQINTVLQSVRNIEQNDEFSVFEEELDKLREDADKLRRWNGGSSFVGNVKKHPNYPKQTNEHNALTDAKWNYELYKFMLNL